MTIGGDTQPLILEIACQDGQLNDSIDVRSWEECWQHIEATFHHAGELPLAVYITFSEGDATDTRNPHPGWHWTDDGVRYYFFKVWDQSTFHAHAGSPESLEAYCSTFSRSENDDLSVYRG